MNTFVIDPNSKSVSADGAGPSARVRQRLAQRILLGDGGQGEADGGDAEPPDDHRSQHGHS